MKFHNWIVVGIVVFAVLVGVYAWAPLVGCKDVEHTKDDCVDCNIARFNNGFISYTQMMFGIEECHEKFCIFCPEIDDHGNWYWYEKCGEDDEYGNVIISCD